MYVPKHNWTKEELMLLHDITYSTRTLAKMFNLRLGTVSSKRRSLGIKSPPGIRKGQSNPNKMRQEIRSCIRKECNVTFQVNQASKKKYCSHSCQQLNANVAPKGIGSRSIRNPKIEEYKRYARKVHQLSGKTYETHKDIINPNNHPRTLCGINEGWQLDHIIPIKECFKKGMSVEEASNLNNLRMLPWKDNLMRNFK